MVFPAAFRACSVVSFAVKPALVRLLLEIEMDFHGLANGLDFLEQCGGKEELAKELFLYCDWQHPSSAWYADFLWDMEE